jgi:hypothetical protein
MMPQACEKTLVPQFFKIAGIAEGNTVPEMQRHIMQELIQFGPLFVSLLLYEDFYDPVAWTESGIYVHRHGNLIGKHAAITIGWGSDSDGRDYWLLLNSFGNGWQQEGYFKIKRGESSLQMMKFDAWGVDWSPEVDKFKPGISDVEVTFSPVVERTGAADPAGNLAAVWLEVAAFTDEATQLLVRVQGLRNTVTGEVKDSDLSSRHVLRVELFKIGLLGEPAKIELWAVDRAENSASWGPYTFHVPSAEAFTASQQLVGRRLVPDGSQLIHI